MTVTAPVAPGGNRGGFAQRQPALGGAWVGIGVSAFVWLVLLAPVVVLLVETSPHDVRAALGPPGALDPLWTSIEASALALALMVALGTPLAYLLARGRLPWPRLVEAGIVTPLLMPPLVIGLLLIFLIGQAGPVGQWISSADPNVFGVNTFFALVVAEFYEAAPYYVLSAAAALATVDYRLVQDAELLGDTHRQAFRKITIPLAAPGLATGLAISWARAMGAFGAVLIVAYNPAGLPIRIDTSFVEFGLPGALPFALLLVVAALPVPMLAFLWSARARKHVTLEPA
ncbi:MAG TPA: ABC transporter permease [Acidimicrobiales bacterium]|nr:ABC transporter permease [Acidimicrobiales bacterium]